MGECIFELSNPKSFQDIQGPKAGPAPWLQMAHFVCTTSLHQQILASEARIRT